MKNHCWKLFIVAAAYWCAIPPVARADLNPFAEYYNNIPRAAAQNDVAKIRQLLSDGYSPNQVDENSRTGLDIAAQNGNMQIIAILYKAHADVNQRDNIGNVPMHYAAERDRLEVVKLLLDMGTPADAENKNGMTALMIAAKVGDTEMMRLLIAHGANPNKSDYTGRDVISWALEGHHAAAAQLVKDSLAHKH
jgi:ankyrin repeat protein